MRSTRYRFTSVALLVTAGAFVVGVDLAPAQVLAPTLPRGEFELGYSYMAYERDLPPAEPVTKEWRLSALFARYGAFGFLTATVQGGTWHVWDEDFDGQRFRRYVVGFGLTARVYERGEYTVAASAHYLDVFDNEETVYRFRKRTWNVTAGVQAERRFPFDAHVATPWIALLYVHDEGITYPWGTPIAQEGASESDLGAAMGLHVNLFGWLVPSAWVVYADHWQGRVSIAVSP
jgi:hypothetical protein